MPTNAEPEVLRLPSGFSAREAWGLDHRFLHLNHGSFGAVPKMALSAQAALKKEMESAPVPWFIGLPNRLAAEREQLARSIGVPTESFVFVPNASAGASVVYNSLSLDANSEVLLTNHGYGAVSMGAKRMAKRFGARVREIALGLDSTQSQIYESVVGSLTDRTRLLVIDQVTSATALMFPVKRIAIACREKGVRVLVDGAHAPGLIDTPALDMAADYWVGNFHKYACAPRGAAALVARPEVADELFPLIDSWGSELSYPERFDHQGTLDLTSYLTAKVSWDFLQRTWGFEILRDYSRRLVSFGAELIADAFSQHTGENHSVAVGTPADSMRIVRLPEGLVGAGRGGNEVRNLVSEKFGTHAAFTEFRGQGFLRLTAHAYNTAADFRDFARRVVPALCKLAEEGLSSQERVTPIGVS